MDWPAIGIGISIGIPAITALLTVIWSDRARLAKLDTALEELRGMIEKRFSTAREERITQISLTKDDFKSYADAHRRAADMGLIEIKQDLQDFQLRVVEEYVREKTFKEFEARVMILLEKLDVKIERLDTKIDKVISPLQHRPVERK